MTTPDRNRELLIHEALFYRGRAELEQAVGEFVRTAATAGEPVMAAVARENLSWLPEALGADGDDVFFEDMGEVGRNPACLIPMIQEWLDDHDGRGYVISEPMWPGRSYAETAECLRHEALVNYALAEAEATVLCPFDAEHLDADVLEGAELTHPRVRDGGGSRRSACFADPFGIAVDERWPLSEPAEPVSEHIFAGDLRSLRRAVVEDPCLGALSRERRDDVVFAVHEAATNTMRHGDGRGLARIWHDGRSVIAEVSSGSAVTDVLAGRRRPTPDALSGRGLWLINQLCDLVQLRSGETGTTLRMHVR
jgi:anti-sigma regulatory factor (Ser/Thr protein kinase)